jgi:hypothetical protein
MAKRIQARAVDNRYIALAIESLRAARNYLDGCSTPRASAAVRKALKSTEGALRHCWNRQARCGVTPVPLPETSETSDRATLEAIRDILGNPENSGADCYDLVSVQLADIGLPVPDHDTDEG